jgi:hypothetical protein
MIDILLPSPASRALVGLILCAIVRVEFMMTLVVRAFFDFLPDLLVHVHGDIGGA